jgi:hypothetical protein
MESVKTNDYVRPPVPSAEEASRAGWMAPVLIVGMSIVIRPQIPIHSVTSIVYGGVICLMTLFGLSAAIWGAYVAWGWGPKKHLVPATIGIVLNSTLVLAIAAGFWAGYDVKQRALSNSSPESQQTNSESSSLIPDRYALKHE